MPSPATSQVGGGVRVVMAVTGVPQAGRQAAGGLLCPQHHWIPEAAARACRLLVLELACFSWLLVCSCMAHE